jgi:hypothetical protein
LRLFVLWVFLVVSSALAASGQLSVAPSLSDDRGLVVQAKTSLQARVTADLPGISHASLNVTRGGRALGDFPLTRQGNSWTTRLRLEFPGAHVLTVRLFEGNRIWSAATDLVGIESTIPKRSQSGSDLEFVVTSGKAGGDVSPAFGLLALLVLIAIVVFGTQVFRKTVKT